MELSQPRFAFRDEILALRDEGFAGRSSRLKPAKFEGVWVAGSLAGLSGRTVAVVGTRAPSDAARARAHALGAALAKAGVCVVSGLALGIDGAAHAGALGAGGRTIGILGGGHRHFFPKRNRALAEAMIAGGGAVLSPFPPDHPPLPPQFIQRNGLVAAFSDAVVIVEAALRSGALNTARWAADIGIDAFAFPGDVDRPKAAGCNELIRDGAMLVRDATDVLAGLGMEHDDARPAVRVPLRTDPLERSVVATLSRDPADFEQLLASTGAATGELISALVALEMDDAVERRDAFTYALRMRR